MSTTPKTSSGRILHNSFWMGLESIIEAVVLLGTGIAVARYLGPAKLGYFSYINFFIVVGTRTSGTGLSTATRKYMSEFLAQDRPGTARAVYDLAHRYQLLASLLIAGLGPLAVFLFGEPQFRLMSSILMLSIVPGLMSWVPAQANVAFEDVSNNTLSAFGYLAVYVIVIALTIHFHWDLAGVAAATLIGRTVEVFLRTVPLNRKLRLMPIETLDTAIVLRLRRFCIQAVGLQLLMSVVFDRSEMLFLRWYSGLVQMGLYSVAFTFGANLLSIPRIFTGSASITLMLETSRDPRRAKALVPNTCRFLLLILLPLCFGAAAIARPAIGLAYGPRYLGAVPAMMVAAILIIPRAFQILPETLLRTGDLQNRILVWFGITALLNIGLDFLLVPHYGPVGAAWANGLAQSFCAAAIWHQARRRYDFSFPLQTAIRVSFASGVMAVAAYFISHRVPGSGGLLLAVLAAVPLYVLLLKVLHGLEIEDCQRLQPIGNRLPGPARRAWLATVAFMSAPAT